LLVGQLPKGPFTLVSDGAEAIRIFDHKESTGQTLLVSNIDELKRGGELVVMDGLDVLVTAQGTLGVFGTL